MKHAWIPALLLIACTNTQPGAGHQGAPAAQLDAVRWSLIEAQDRRDARALITALQDSLASTRAQAALGLASVGDTVAVPALLAALGDADATVRRHAAFAFGFCGDSVNVHRLIERYSSEREPPVRGQIAEAAGRCGRRAGADLLLRRSLATRADTLGVLRGIFLATTTNSIDTGHVRYALSLIAQRDAEVDRTALQVAARSRAELVRPYTKRLLDIAMAQPGPGHADVRLPLVAALGRTGDPEAFTRLEKWAFDDPDPRIRVMALRGIGRFEEPGKNDLIWKALQDTSAMVRDLAVEEVLKLKELPDGQTMWITAQEHSDHAVKIPLYGLVLRKGDPDTQRTCRLLLKSMAEQGALGPYLDAALTRARLMDPDGNPAADIAEPLLAKAVTAQERLAAFESALVYHGDRTTAGIELLRRVFMPPCDAGLISAACERLAEMEPEMLGIILDTDAIASARAALHPIRDLESLQLLDAAIARRDGLPAPLHKAPPFNHPIDREHLQAIAAGRQYRISTGRGDIIVELEPTAAPGSCVAFDSLVTAGYYNGKYFHRVVPDFVAQGGCPRGDGYGGMPWTLRTEVGLGGFTTGAVGLASAGKDTESCQFFIMLADAPHLDGRYTRFAHVVSGMDVVWRLRVGDVMSQVERLP